jgi:hypothetical protein
VTGVAVKVMKIGTGEDREEVTEEGKDAAAVSLGRRGGKARAESLTQTQRTDIAKKAARSRWGRKQS